MFEEHDYKNYPELSNAQLATDELTSPHVQIKNDFDAVVVKVVDGDTVRLACDFRDFVFPLRFANVDAPEMSENGEKAKEWLRSMIEGEEVRILIDPKNRVEKYGRLLGSVLHNGMEMGQAMLQLGMVVPFGKKKEGEVPFLDKAIPELKWS